MTRWMMTLMAMAFLTTSTMILITTVCPNNNSGKIRVHAAISPNGDGVGNDAMYIENIEKYERNEVVLFNRWGGTVYKTSNYNNTDNNFKGLNNSGKEVTDGSYFYSILVWDSAGKQEQYVGFIVIKRK
jgi:gliding motility-associated-like protein